jgi:hypothetical protein
MKVSSNDEVVIGPTATMSITEQRWLTAAKSRRQPTWLERYCRTPGKDCHLLLSIHPLGIVRSGQPVRIAVWRRRGTINRAIGELGNGAPELAGHKVLDEIATIVELPEDPAKVPNIMWWVGCYDTITTFYLRTNWNHLVDAWSGDETRPIRVFTHDRT